MTKEYQSFQDLPPEIAEVLKKEIVEGEKKDSLKIQESASTEETIRIIQDACKDPYYTQKELEQIVNAFSLFNNAVKRGLPNQLYQMMVKTLDTEIAQRAYAAHAIWYAHEGDELAKEAIQEFADRLKAGIDKRVDWDEEQFHREYFLGRK